MKHSSKGKVQEKKHMVNVIDDICYRYIFQISQEIVFLNSHRRSIFRRIIFTSGNLYKNQATGVIHPKFKCKYDHWITEETYVKKERLLKIRE
jgi:hypothetical protein